MSYDPDKLWSEAEDRAVRTFYPRHGSDWVGWFEVLPSRTRRAIAMRASRLGVSSPPRKKKPRQEGPIGIRAEPQEYEERIMALMGRGMTPIEIDQTMHWWAGTTIRILRERWERQDEQDED